MTSLKVDALNLDALIKNFITFEALFLCLSVYLITHVTRKVLLGLWPRLEKHRLWSSMFLPLAAIFIGALCGFGAKTFVWPEVIGSHILSRMLWGAICGSFSAFVYGRVRSFLSASAKTDEALPQVDQELEPEAVVSGKEESK